MASETAPPHRRMISRGTAPTTKMARNQGRGEFAVFMGMSRHWLLSVLLLFLAGCEGRALWETPQMRAAKEEDAKATGAACRLAGHTLEDCFNQSPRQGKAPMLVGWKQMNDYMTEAKLTPMPPASNNPPASCEQKKPTPNNNGR